MAHESLQAQHLRQAFPGIEDHIDRIKAIRAGRCCFIEAGESEESELRRMFFDSCNRQSKPVRSKNEHILLPQAQRMPKERKRICGILHKSEQQPLQSILIKCVRQITEAPVHNLRNPEIAILRDAAKVDAF